MRMDLLPEALLESATFPGDTLVDLSSAKQPKDKTHLEFPEFTFCFLVCGDEDITLQVIFCHLCDSHEAVGLLPEHHIITSI